MDNYLDEHDHVGESHPQAFAWRQAAVALDKKMTIAMFREYNSLTRAMLALEPQRESDEEDDPLLAAVVGLETRGA